MALGDIYELKHIQRDFDQKHIENVYFYRHDADPVGGLWATQAERLARDWVEDVLPVMNPSIPGAYQTNEVRVRNLFDAGDVFVFPVSIYGTRASTGTEYQPSFLAVKATLSSSNGLVRKGRKMFAGMFESDQALGVLTLLGLPLWTVRAATILLGVSTLFGGAKAFNPVVVKRIREGTPGNYTYRLPETPIEAVFGYVQSAVISSIVTAQDTRKK